MSPNSKIYDSIIISSYLFGSMYIFSNTLRLINKSFLYETHIGRNVLFLTCAVSGSICIHSYINFVDSLYGVG